MVLLILRRATWCLLSVSVPCWDMRFEGSCAWLVGARLSMICATEAMYISAGPVEKKTTAPRSQNEVVEIKAPNESPVVMGLTAVVAAAASVRRRSGERSETCSPGLT